MSTYRERRLERAERLREWAAKRAARSSGQFKRAHDLVSGIPLGQPILVGHHSERRHRRTLERSDAAMRAGWEDSNKAADMKVTAANIEDAADRAIYMDDPDAIERLTAKIAELEAKRDARKRANVIVRNKKIDAATKTAQLAELLQWPAALAAKLLEPDCCGRLGFPAYSLQNIGGTITKERARLARLQADQTPVGSAVVAPTAATATARAGLTITAAMTTPAKAWKKPRPVWNVSGNLAFWRPLLVEQLDGTKYGGVISFWSDPTEAIERAALEAEAGGIWAETPEADSERDRLLGIAADKYPDLDGTALSDQMQADERRARAHRAADPHCTCPDCIVAHFETEAQS